MAETKTKAKKKSLFEGQPTTKIKIPFTRDETEDVWVAVNGKSMQIKRGEEVEVPVCIAKALQHQEDMLIQAIRNEEALAKKAMANEIN